MVHTVGTNNIKAACGMCGGKMKCRGVWSLQIYRSSFHQDGKSLETYQPTYATCSVIVFNEAINYNYNKRPIRLLVDTLETIKALPVWEKTAANFTGLTSGVLNKVRSPGVIKLSPPDNVLI